MATSVPHVLAQMQLWTSSAHAAEHSDAVLLERYVHQREEAAFAALVARHGAMVLRICRQVLGDAQAAEDAFQAVFLILARKAHSLKQPDAVSAWLHGVARRVALKARGQSMASVRSTPLDETLPDPRPDPLTQVSARELLNVFDEEVQYLPKAQRSAVVLCCLEGRTREEAAAVLGWTIGSLRGHLERGRHRLQARLRKRGIALSAALAVVVLMRDRAGANVPEQTLRGTVRAALHGGIGRSAAALAHSVLKTMAMGKLAGVMTVALTVILAASAAVALVYHGRAEETTTEKPPAAAALPNEAKTDKPQSKTDALGDPLPRGAVARLGTVRLRTVGGVASPLLGFTPDGKRLVSQSSDGVQVWDAATGKELRCLRPPQGRMWRARSELSPDGKHVIVSEISPTGSPLEFWDLESGKKIDSLEERFFSSGRYSSDGKLLAALTSNTEVSIWDWNGRKKLRSWQSHQRQTLLVAFSADSRKLLTRGAAGEVRLWDVATGRQLHEFKPLDWKADAIIYSPPSDCALSADGKKVALIEKNDKQTAPSGKVEWKARIHLLDTATGKLLRELKCGVPESVFGPRTSFHDVKFSPDNKRVITCGPDAFIRIWDANTGEELRRIPGGVLQEQLVLSKDGNKLAVVFGHGSAFQVFDVKRGEITTPGFGHLSLPQMAALAPDGRTAVTGSLIEDLLVWDTATGWLRRRLPMPALPITALQLGSDGRTLFTLGWDKSLRLWDLDTGTERRRFTVECNRNQIPPCGLALTPDGKTLAVVDEQKSIRVYDVATGRDRQRFQGPEGILGMKLTPDGRSLIAWSGDLKVRVWDTETGRKQGEHSLPPARTAGNAVPPGTNEYYNAALSPDGRMLAMGPIDKRIPPSVRNRSTGFLILMDVQTGVIVHRIEELPSDTGLIAFSPDGRTLAWTGFADATIRLLETASGRERKRLSGHRGQITALAFSADGRRLLSGCADTTGLVWDLSGGARKASLAEAERESLWADLAAHDAARAYQALHRLAKAPPSTISFVNKRLAPIPPVEEKRLARLLADLDSDDFAMRQQATMELTKLGEQALPACRKALDGKPSPESRRRLEVLMEKATRAWWDTYGERLRSLRAVEALELAGTPEAREMLKTLAAGADGARLTEAAKAALQRLAQRR